MGTKVFPAGAGPQLPEEQVQKSSGGVLSWLGVTRQLYHQLYSTVQYSTEQDRTGDWDSPDVIKSCEVATVEIGSGRNTETLLGALSTERGEDGEDHSE